MINGKTVVGAMLVSRCADVLDITIPNLLKWCDWILIVMDNESPEVVEKINKYVWNNYNKIWLRRSSFPHQVFGADRTIMDYHHRWKQLKGEIRDEVFHHVRNILDLKQPGYDKIDVFIFQDHDEIFTDYFPELLDEFWESDYKAIATKPVDVVGGMDVVRKESKGYHVYVMKYNRELAGLPRRFHAMYYPLTHSDVMNAAYYSVHLAYLMPDTRRWRTENWKRDMALECDLWRTEKSVEHMSPREIKDIFKQKPNERLSTAN